MLNVVIDLSNNNFLNFDLMQKMQKSGIKGIIHKATEGTTYTDSLYHERHLNARKLELLWGAYHFGNNIHSGVDQADHFLEVTKPSDNKDLVLMALDIESNKDRSMSIKNAQDFVKRIHEKTGRWPGLYSGNYIKSLLGEETDPVLSNCWLWHAEYGSLPHFQATWKKWTLWQYTNGHDGPEPHLTDGVGLKYDRNLFDGDENALRAFWKGH